MKVLIVFGLIALALHATACTRSQWNTPGLCSKAELLGHAPNPQNIDEHRQFKLPVVSYPFGTEQTRWGFMLVLRVDEQGKVVCYSPRGEYGEEEVSLKGKRRELIAALPSWRYTPFVKGGRAVPAILTERIDEQELPTTRRLPPTVPLEDVRITLERTGCFGWCPSYCVTVQGNGQAIYQGRAFVDVTGTHHYQIPTADVAQLLKSLRDKDLWSMRPEYFFGVTDNPTYRLTITLGRETYTIRDYVGRSIGMPAAVTEFENDVDRIGRSKMWMHLTREAVAHLKAEGFDFHSRAAADLLARAVANPRGHDDEAMLELINLGVPLDAESLSEDLFTYPAGPLIEVALRYQRVAIIDALIAGGALNMNGRPDPAKTDAAFRAAIEGGRLELVQQIWEVSGERRRPQLVFTSSNEHVKRVEKTAPVTLLLRPPDHLFGQRRWDGLSIAKWLREQGCDVKAAAADGTTLLHIAADAGDAAFVKYLLDAGLNPASPGKYDLPALGSADNEDVAMLLLEAGTPLARVNSDSFRFRDYAEYMHWERVVGWLEAHGQ